MTDTARTLTEVKTLLANNTSQAISAQDMRDVVESIANPVPGGGLDIPVGPSTQFFAFDSTPISTTSGQNLRGFDMANANAFSDVGGLLAAVSYDSTYMGETFAAGSYIELPAGVWVIDGYGTWASNAVGDRICEPIHIDSRLTLAANADTVNPVFGGTNQWQMLSSDTYHSAAALPSNGAMGTHAVFFITPDMIASSHADRPSGASWAITFQAWQNSGGPLNLTTYALVAAKVAGT